MSDGGDQLIQSLPRVVKEKPILFSAPMVRAILADKKTQTRRVLNAYQLRFFAAATAAGEISDFLDTGVLHPNDPSYICDHCPYGQVGECMWVKETWRVHESFDALRPLDATVSMGGRDCVNYCATPSDGAFWGKTRVSIHMPRWASRLTLEIADVRVERLNAISEEDAKAEGVDGVFYHDGKGGAVPHTDGAYRKDFERLWDSIHGPLSFRLNGAIWVWAISFRRA